ncbi:MAG: hypothetical protein ACI8TP_003901 [Acidimicrobiales bacterium]
MRVAYPSPVSHVIVSRIINRSVTDVWDDVADISSHVTWMLDAVAIRFTDEQTSGVGTTFECDTKIGPISLTDVMEITAWEDEARMGVRHIGLVTGVGEFTLHPIGKHKTNFRWEEKLSFPWWLGGPVGELIGKPILAFIWNGNLKRLKARLET